MRALQLNLIPLVVPSSDRFRQRQKEFSFAQVFWNIFLEMVEEEREEDHGEESETQPGPDGVEGSNDVQTGESVGGVVEIAQYFCLANILLYGGDNHRDLVVYRAQ